MSVTVPCKGTHPQVVGRRGKLSGPLKVSVTPTVATEAVWPTDSSTVGRNTPKRLPLHPELPLSFNEGPVDQVLATWQRELEGNGCFAKRLRLNSEVTRIAREGLVFRVHLADGEVIEPVPGSWGRKGATFVWYERLDPDRLPDLMRLAWARVAPKRLLR